MPTSTDTPRTRGSRSRIGRVVQQLGWRAILAATVLALLAAGTVLWIAGDSDDAGVTTDGTLMLTPADEVADGDPLDVEFSTRDDDTATLAQVVDGPTVVNFFASWCPPCVGEMPDFEAVSQDLAGQVRFFGLAVNDRRSDAEAIAAQTGISYEWGHDSDGDVINAAGALNMPTTMFVAADGTVVSVHSGALDRAELRALIEEHLGVPA